MSVILQNDVLNVVFTCLIFVFLFTQKTNLICDWNIKTFWLSFVSRLHFPILYIYIYFSDDNMRDLFDYLSYPDLSRVKFLSEKDYRMTIY